MKRHSTLTGPLKNEHGVSTVLIALILLVLLAFSALAIDVGHLFVVRNELKNAADAGALAGARVLFLDNGETINTGADAVAEAAAIANKSDKITLGSSNVEVERGHWSFINKAFTPNDSTVVIQFWNYTTQELDVNTEYINAVRVTTKRGASNAPISSFFAKVLGFNEFAMQQRAVAWIGFAGPIPPEGVDQPIAICKESIVGNDGTVECNVGRMLNSGGNAATHNTAGWTNFTQPCETASASSVRPLICANGNPNEIYPRQGVGTTGGTVSSALADLTDCWASAGQGNDTDGDGTIDQVLDSDGDGIPDRGWQLKLLVVKCPGNNVSNCAEVTGVIKLTLLWINDKNDPQYKEVPRKMSVDSAAGTRSWQCTAADGEACWNDFVAFFNLQTWDGQPAEYMDKSFYFLPACEYTENTGGSGGENYGVHAKIPKLVQ